MKTALKIVLTATALFVINQAFGQVIPDDPDINAVPVDGGIITVLGSAAAYGVYRLKNKK